VGYADQIRGKDDRVLHIFGIRGALEIATPCQQGPDYTLPTREHTLGLQDVPDLLGASWVLPGCFLGVSWVILDAYWVFTTQECMSSCSTRRHVFLFNKNTPVHVFSFNRKAFLLMQQEGLLAQQEDKFSCSARRHVFLPNMSSY